MMKSDQKTSHTEGQKGSNTTLQKLAPPDVYEPPVRQPISVKGGEELKVLKDNLTKSLLEEAMEGCAIHLMVAKVLSFLAWAKAYPMDPRSQDVFSKWIDKNLKDQVIEVTSEKLVKLDIYRFDHMLQLHKLVISLPMCRWKIRKRHLT